MKFSHCLIAFSTAFALPSSTLNADEVLPAKIELDLGQFPRTKVSVYSETSVNRIALQESVDLGNWSNTQWSSASVSQEWRTFNLDFEPGKFYRGRFVIPSFTTVIADQTVQAGSSIAAVPFSISDILYPSDLLELTVSSSNESLVPSSSIALSGSGFSRELVLTASSSGTGSATVYLKVASPDGFSSSISFLVTVTESSVGNVLSAAAFVSKMEGKRFSNTATIIDSATRFSWNGDQGNWSYTVTGANTAKLVFTYDEDANNESIYREEIVLTYDTDHTGDYAYSEYWNDELLDSNSGMFDLDVVDTGTIGISPTKGSFANLVVGGTLLNTSFKIDSENRFTFALIESGNWSYEKTGVSTGKIVLTYDEDDNNPAVYREEVELTFSSPTEGSFVFKEFSLNILDDTLNGLFALLGD